MTASGTAGLSTELADSMNLSLLGAVVVKSLAAYEWAGNPPPRLRPTAAGMLNSVGLQGPGVRRWLDEHLPALADAGARVVASIWGRTLADYETAASLLADAPAGQVLAVEVNVSCPNIEDRGRMFGCSPDATSQAVSAARVCGLPLWAKLSPAVADIVPVAAAAAEAGAEAVTLINTLPGMVINTETRLPALGGTTGGLSGRALHPVAVRAVWEVHAALPDLPIVGVGGVSTAADAVDLLLAGANAVQVGTATFADPRAPLKVLNGMTRWCARHDVQQVADIVGAAHR